MVRAADLFCKLLGALIAAALLLMVVLVFSNVVMRYVFNSGITVAEELARWLFVWITFLGAVIAVRKHAHLGTDAVVARLPAWGQRTCLVLGHLTMLYVCWLVFKGSLEQTRINWEVLAPSTQWPLAIVYAAGLVFSVASGVMLLLDLWLLVTGQVADDQLVMIQESEDLAAMEAARAAAAPKAGH